MRSYRDSFHEFTVNTVKSAAEKLKAEAERGYAGLVLAEAAKNFLKKAGYEIDYARQDEANFKLLRQRLNTESGVVICNHPGMPDTLSVIAALDRDDVLIMAKDGVAENGAKIFGEKYFVPAEHGPVKSMAVLRKALGHINKGGVFVIFPSGGREKGFQPGLGFLLKHMRPEDMVYCFHVNSQDVTKGKKFAAPRVVTAAAELAHGYLKNPLKYFPHKVRVDEEYTQAQDWQSLLVSKSDREQQSKNLEKHYKEIFGQIIENRL